MLKTLSYVNISLAIIYYLLYLINGNPVAVIGVLIIVAYNGFVISNVERELKFGWLHYSLGFCSSGFVGILIVWTVNILLSSLANNYFSDSWLYIILSALLIICMMWQLLLVWKSS